MWLVTEMEYSMWEGRKRNANSPAIVLVMHCKEIDPDSLIDCECVASSEERRGKGGGCTVTGPGCVCWLQSLFSVQTTEFTCL